MIFSMTGYGDARTTTPSGTLALEIRSVNNRHLKVTVRGSDPYPMLEAEVEKVVRRHVKRGTVLVQVRAERTASAANARLNTALLRAYVKQIEEAVPAADRQAVLAGVLGLPGVAPEAIAASADEEWPHAEAGLETALKKLNEARQIEGAAMAAELNSLKNAIADELAKISEHVPRIVASYRARLLERVKGALAETGVNLSPDHVIREVALFADRSDVAEEMTRLTGHLASFDSILAEGGEGAGRRLEFVVQEMGRETNTLGSKAGDVTVSRHAVEVKASLEKIRELVQNIE